MRTASAVMGEQYLDIADGEFVWVCMCGKKNIGIKGERNELLYCDHCGSNKAKQPPRQPRRWPTGTRWGPAMGRIALEDL